eukprot:TRINITY_DN24810_c0_g1_i4.p1 TRINITY_DN24810_c0_g1~~TRINITY_DN24810_c0_g1_i4.p1  ORF type:complete len:507 (-),score=50.09 TRINITY_DN24810_c0_g1_i4:345-1808(-)
MLVRHFVVNTKQIYTYQVVSSHYCWSPGSGRQQNQHTIIIKHKKQLSHYIIAGRGRVIVQSKENREVLDEQQINASQQEEELREICRQLLLAFNACKGGYLFASQCFVESVINAFRKKYLPEQIKGCVQYLGLQCGAQLLAPIEEDILMQWVVIIHKTLVECYGIIKNEKYTSGETQMMEGMSGFVKEIMQQWLSGTSLKELEVQQQLARQDAIQQQGAVGPTLKVMQQSARFVMLTLEIVEIVENLQLREGAPTVSSNLFITDYVPGVSQNADEVRTLSVQLLVCLIGSIMGNVLSLNQFVIKAWEGYVKGYSVDKILHVIKGYEFLQQTDLIPVGIVVSGQANPESVNMNIFGRRLSIVYMTWAQLGYPIANLNDQEEGWAIPSDQDASEAIDLAAFVTKQLQSYEQQQQQFQQRMSDPVVLAKLQENQEKSLLKERESVLVKVEDSGLAATSSSLLVLQQLISLIKIALAQLERVVYSQATTLS